MKLRVKQKLEKIAGTFKIALIFVFGSKEQECLRHLDGEKSNITDPLADIDLGVVFLQGKFPTKPHDLFGHLYYELLEIFVPYKLDLVFLEETGHLFQFEAIKGSCIYQTSHEARENYIESVLRYAADWRVMRDQIDREYLSIGQ